MGRIDDLIKRERERERERERKRKSLNETTFNFVSSFPIFETSTSPPNLISSI